MEQKVQQILVAKVHYLIQMALQQISEQKTKVFLSGQRFSFFFLIFSLEESYSNCYVLIHTLQIVTLQNKATHLHQSLVPTPKQTRHQLRK